MVGVRVKVRVNVVVDLFGPAFVLQAPDLPKRRKARLRLAACLPMHRTYTLRPDLLTGVSGNPFDRTS